MKTYTIGEYHYYYDRNIHLWVVQKKDLSKMPDGNFTDYCGNKSECKKLIRYNSI